MGQARGLFLGADPLDDRGGGADLVPAPGLAGFRRGGRPPALQRRRRLLAGQQGRQRAGRAQEGPGAEGAHAARQPVAVDRCRRPGARRRGHHRRRRDRAGRRAPDRGRLSQRRPGSTHRRIPAGRQARRRRGLFGQHRQAGLDDRGGHGHRQPDLLRPHRQAGGLGRVEIPLRTGGPADRRLPDPARRCPGPAADRLPGLSRRRGGRRLGLGRRWVPSPSSSWCC